MLGTAAVSGLAATLGLRNLLLVTTCHYASFEAIQETCRGRRLANDSPIACFVNSVRGWMVSGGNLQCGMLTSLLWAKAVSVCNRPTGVHRYEANCAVKGVVVLVYSFPHGSTHD